MISFEEKLPKPGKYIGLDIYKNFWIIKFIPPFHIVFNNSIIADDGFITHWSELPDIGDIK